MAYPVAASIEPAFSFGPFRLLPNRLLLLDGDSPVRLGSRAFELLTALVERPGELLSKEQLIARVWPTTHIAEGNLKLQVAGLRRALGDGRDGRRYIVATPGQGYRFVGAVTAADDHVSSHSHSPTLKHNLPVQLTRLIGRADVVSKLSEQLALRRLLTIVGPGGIGKTVVALAIAEELIPAYEHGVWLIDLAPITDPRLVPTALASALKLEVRSDNPLPGLAGALSDKRMLLVLDNCEHVIEPAASLCSEVLRGSRGVHILATSREPLRTQSEYVHRLLPLAVPPLSHRLTGAEALQFPAVQLFVERVAANMNDFELSDADASSAGDICCKLDGVPLAIELAAARVDTFGVRGLAGRLDDRLRFLTGGRRAVPLRHRAIGATLDWSFELLNQDERTVFRRLAIFGGGFTEEAASAVAAGTDDNPLAVTDILADLVSKSVVTADVGSGEVRFRLLQTMRAYAATKLADSGERDALAQRHAIYFLDLLEEPANSRAADEFAAAHTREIDNIRAALSWAFGPSGDEAIAVALSAASAPLWLEKSLLTECHDWSAKALDILREADRGTRLEMILQTEFGLALMFTRGMSATARSALSRARELAERLQDHDYEMRALGGLTIFCTRSMDFRGALVLARQLEPLAIAAADPVAMGTADALLGAILFASGDVAGASIHVHRAHKQDTRAVRRAQIVRYGMAHSWVHARNVMAQVQWLQGLLDRCDQTIRDVLADTASNEHPVSLGFALNWSLFVLSYWKLDTIEPCIAWLKDHAEKHALSSYTACALGYEGLLQTKRGNIVAGERLLRACLSGLRQAQYEVLYERFLGGLAETLMAAGRFDESLAIIDEALNLANLPLWALKPEALRIKGEVILASNGADVKPAEGQFRQSLDVARNQGALFWELRSTMSLGRLCHTQGHTIEARHLLQSVYVRFTEGFGASDLQSARRLLDEWDPSGSVSLRLA